MRFTERGEAADMADALGIRGCQRSPDVLVDLISCIVRVVIAALGASDFDAGGKRQLHQCP